MSTQYAYKVRDTSGHFREGKVKAESEAAVAEQLLSMGYVPLEVKPAGTGLNKEISFGRKRVTLKDLAVFSRQLATMVDAGLTLMRGLTILSEQVENPELRRALHEVKTSVEGGLSLSAAFAEDKRNFPPFLISMVRAGEVGGFLDVALKQVAETFEAEVKLRAKIKAAMTYPVVVFCMAIIMCIGMLLFVVPVFEKMFEDLGGELPLPTQFLVTLSGLVRWAAPFIAVALIAFVVWWRRHGQDDNVREFIDPLKLKLPVFGPLFTKIALTRFSRNLGTLLGVGVPVLQALDVVGATTGNAVISTAMTDLQNAVREGQPMSSQLHA